MNGTKITSWMEFKDTILSSNGNPLVTVVQRDGQLVTLKLEPQAIVGEDGKSNFRLGVGAEESWSYKKMTFSTAVANASVSTWYGLKQMLGMVGRLFSGKQSVKLLLGPVGIIDQAGQAVQEGSYAVINLMAIISLTGMPALGVLMPVFGDYFGGPTHGARTFGLFGTASGVGALVGSVMLANRKTVVGLGFITSPTVTPLNTEVSMACELADWAALNKNQPMKPSQMPSKK